MGNKPQIVPVQPQMVGPITRIMLEVDSVGNTKLKSNTPISAARLISILSQTINANAIQIMQQEELLINPNRKPAVEIPPHEFNGDEAGICTVCGKLENAHVGTVVQ